MNKTENYHYISDLLLKEATGTLTDAEQQELKAWKADDAHREQLSEWMRDYGFLQEEYRAWKSVDVEKAVHEMEQRIQGDSHEEPSAKKSPQISYLRIFRYAAAVLILVVAGAALWYSQYTKVTPPEISEEVQTAMVLSVKSGKQDANIVSISEALSIKSEESEGSEELRMKNEESFSENASDHSSLSSLHSSLQVARYQMQVSRHEWRQARAALFPTLSLSAGLNTTYYHTLHANSGQSFHAQFKNNMGEYVGITLSIPLFDRLQTVTSIRRAKNNYRIARENYEQKRLELEKLSREAWQDWIGYLKQTEQMAKKVEADSLSHQLTRRQFEEGLSTAIDLQTTSTQLQKSRAMLLQCQLMAIVKKQLVRYYQGIAIWTE